MRHAEQNPGDRRVYSRFEGDNGDSDLPSAVAKKFDHPTIDLRPSTFDLRV